MAGEKTETGTGGINIDNNVYGMDVGVPDAEGGSQGQWSGGNINVDKSVKDISKPTKETFAKYMSKTTLGQAGSSTHPNAYPVGKGDGTKVEDYSIKTIDGLPQPLAETNNETKFATVGIGVTSLQADFVKKGLSGGGGLDGNELLPKAAAPADAGGPYVKPSKGLNEKQQVYLSEVIKKNRFNPSTNFEVDSYLESLTVKQDRRLVLPNNLKLGVSPAEQEALGEETKRYTYEQLAHVGTILQLAATGEYAVVLNDDPNVGADKINPDDPLVALSTLLPGLGQLGAGAPLPTEYLKVERIIEKVPDDPVTAEQLTDFNSKFEGVINSSFEKFSGFSSLGMSALVATLSIAIVGAFTSIAALVGAGPQGPSMTSQIKTGKKLGLGNSTGYKTTGYPEDLVSLIASFGQGSAAEFFGIQKTVNKFGDALKIGVQSTFGLDSNFAPKLTFESSGYLVTVSRSIVRAVSAIVLQFIEIGELLASANPLANVDDVFAKTLELISSIKNSRFIKCINVFAQIGDKVAGLWNAYDKTLPQDSGKRISISDFFPDGDFSNPYFYSKSRITNMGGGTFDNKPDPNALKLVWAANRTPDAYILPARVDLFSRVPQLGSPMINAAPKDKYSRFQDMNFLEDTQSYRIPAEEVKKIEDKFEAEYVPFYIQDLRTNEIIGFHAFLSSLTDEYTANYDASEGIGRMDPVKIYKNTTRRVGVSFVLAALDALDFDSMWQKINKLTTFVYPQYTQGKVLSSPSGDYIFEKPFTQMIGASPMVRLRVGNLFASNYSKFNIAGIFGLRNPAATLNSANIASGVTSAADDDKLVYQPGNTFLLKLGTYSTLDGVKIDTSRYGEIFSAQIISEAPFEMLGESGFFVKLALVMENQFPGIDYNSLIPKIETYKRWEFFRTIDGDQADGATVFVKKENLSQLDNASLEKIKPQAPASYATEMQTFLNEDNNAITRSFKTTGGRGLAGFIDNISFDWNSATWDLDVGRKAPKMCKITLGFTPIHDISPGIDAYGYNRAPIYPLGPFARRDRG